MTQLDYSLKTYQERLELVNKILEENPNPNRAYLTILGDYLALCMTKEEKKERKILTDNRMVTINKRETSYEGLAEKFENGEDGIYSILDNNRNTIFQKKQRITPEDVKERPELQQTLDAIEFWKGVVERTTGKEKFMAKKALIEFRKEQYVIKSSNYSAKHHPVTTMTTKPSLESNEWIGEDGNVHYSGVSLCNPTVCSAILCNYSILQSEPGEELWNLVNNFDKMRAKALKEYPLLDTIVEDKIAGKQNIDIQKHLLDKFGTTHSLEYISSLWRKKIPNLIALAAEDDYLNWYYTYVEKGKWKKCSRCGKVKLAHNKYFSKNSTSKDGFYSICKCCRNKKKNTEEELWRGLKVGETD